EFDERAQELADARAERWHAELENTRTELDAITVAREAAEHDARDVRDQLAELREQLDRAREATRIAGNEASERSAERGGALAAQQALSTRLQDAQSQIEALHEDLDVQGSEHVGVVEHLNDAVARVAALEAELEAAEETRARVESELQQAEERRTRVESEL